MSGDVCSDGGAFVDTTVNRDRSLPVSLDMWDGWKAVGDIGVDFKTQDVEVACTLLQTDHIIVTDSNKCC